MVPDVFVCMAALAGGVALCHHLVTARETGIRVDAAWAEARRALGAAGSKRKLRSERLGLDFSMREVSTGFGKERRIFAECQVAGLPALRGVGVRATPTPPFGSLNGLFCQRTGDAEFDGRYDVHAQPHAAATLLFDTAFREHLLRTGLHLELDGERLSVRREAAAPTVATLRSLMQDAEATAARWLALVDRLAGFAVVLGEEANPSALRFEGTTLLGATFRQGRSWRLELVCTHDECTVRLHSAEENITLRFDARSATLDDVRGALDEEEQERGVRSGYR